VEVTPLRVLPTPAAIGDYVAERLLERIEHARQVGRRFLLGCPTGLTPQPIYDEITRHRCDLSHVVLVMMDEYVPSAGEPWSCHAFVEKHMPWKLFGVWFPDPREPAAYDQRITEAGGIDFFLLASGALDGHVAFNQPGSPRDSRTRIVPLSAAARRENVPDHGVTVGIATITGAREAMMVVWGAAKRLTLQRILAAKGYDPSWPATVIHECPIREIVCDLEASATAPDAVAAGRAVGGR